MKNYKYLLLIFLSVSISFYSCDDDDEDNTPATPAQTGPTQNIAEIAIADSRTDSLVVALSEAELVATFQGNGSFTVFAPTNQAFRDLLATNSSWNKIADIGKPTLTNVLLYHVLGTKVMSGDLTDDTYGTTLNTQGTANNEATVLEVDVNSNGVMINNTASVEQANIEATNGVIHIIDAVIMPRNVVELAINDERFSTLVQALQVFGDTLTGALSGTGPFTVFAPTNDAFQALLDGNSAWNSLNDIPRATLDAVLRYHVIPNKNAQASQISQGENLSTLNNLTLTVDLSNGAQLMTGDTAQSAVNIIVTDVQGTNGVVHAVEEVLLP